MSTRTTRRTVEFASGFMLSAIGCPLPAGIYEIEEDHEIIEGLSWIAYQRTATSIRLPAISAKKSARIQFVAIDHAELEAAVERDRGIPRVGVKAL